MLNVSWLNSAAVGHLYHAKPQLAKFYQRLDPCNCVNPGIGQASKVAKYREAAV
jgi:D-lactate dehydrogenase (quinone)